MKAILILLSTLCLTLGGWALWENSRRQALEEELAATKAEREKLARRAVLGSGMQSGVVISETGPTGLEEKAKELGLNLKEDEDTGRKKPSLKKAPGEKSAADPAGEDLAKMLRDPSMRDTLRAQSDAFLDFEYRDLFDLMKLDESKREKVLAILKERSAKQAELGMKGVDGKVNPDDRTKMVEEFNRFTKDSGEQLKELLGDNYSKFERFEKSAPEREHLKTLNSMLKDKGLSLDEATETRLMDVMYDTRRGFRFDHDLTGAVVLAPGDLTREVVDRYFQQTDELQKQVQEKAKAVLTPEQFEVFVKSQADQKQLEQLNIQMLREVSGEGKAADARN